MEVEEKEYHIVNFNEREREKEVQLATVNPNLYNNSNTHTQSFIWSEEIIGLQMGKKTDKFYYFTTSLCIYYVEQERVVKVVSFRKT